MIEVKNISKIFGHDYIFKDVSFTINDTDKIGIVGANGAGKSTLLKSIVFDDYITEGEVVIKGSTGYIDQTKLLDDSKTLFIQYLETFPELFNLYNFLQQDENHQDVDEYIKKEASFNEKGGYDFRIKVDRLLTGFGFEKEDIKREVHTFSGGEKTKLSLIKLLLLEPDFLFLDEPTNHLDLSAIIWLEKYLKSLKKSIILISHDEVFLEAVCNKIILVQNQGVRVYKTNFYNYIKQRKLDYEQEVRDYENQLALLKKYEEFIEKNRGKPTKIGQVNDRKAKVEKIELLQKPKKVEAKIDFEFEGYHLKRSTYIDLFDVSVGYEGQKLIENINFKVYGGDKIAIIGRNGIGKSTFFKALLERKAISGKIKIPSNIKIGYFDQEQAEIDHKKTIYEIIEQTKKFDSQSAIRKYLGKFLFTRDDVFKKFSKLSGGEKVRMTLAIMTLEKYDILLLDEPTNHLDMEVKNTLIDALKKFPATLIFVTHDRKLISEVANRILHFKKEGAEEFFLDWEEYIKDIKEKPKKSKNSNDLSNEDSLDQPNDLNKINEQKDLSKDENKKPKKINQQKLDRVEEEILEFEKKQKEIFDKLLLPEVLKDYKKKEQTTQELDIVTKKLEELYKVYDDIF